MSTAEKDGELAAECQGTLLYNESLAEYTTWGVSGLAAKMYKPANAAGLALFLRNLPQKRAVVVARILSTMGGNGFSETCQLYY
ncbi:hypothetical protein [Legionella saoudiensis]|uniref:hypothetical protein n=1 Tax=Legionella saoudiensis TaxID=1750561 RepID=UPI00073055F1|nr:hypothetical protein [Legionella saoudiensis]